jgi:hypothetical protein
MFLQHVCRNGALGQTRTDTPVKATDFESVASTNSATRADPKVRSYMPDYRTPVNIHLPIIRQSSLCGIFMRRKMALPYAPRRVV